MPLAIVEALAKGDTLSGGLVGLLDDHYVILWCIALVMYVPMYVTP